MPKIEYTRTLVVHASGKARMVDVPRVYCFLVGEKVSPEDFYLYGDVITEEQDEEAYVDSLAICG